MASIFKTIRAIRYANEVPTKAKLVVVIPAFNEEAVIGSVVQQVTEQVTKATLVVVDDGSADHTYTAAVRAGATVISHRVNRGKGAATKTGIEAAKLLGADIVVTMDGDGQHQPEDINKLVAPIEDGQCDVALGTRLFKSDHMPATKVISNHIANFITWTMHGLWVRDSQSGFRAYSRKALEHINTTADQYDYESEVIREIHTFGLVYKEIPINVQYTDYSMNKAHRQSVVNGFKTLYKMVWKVVSMK